MHHNGRVHLLSGDDIVNISAINFLNRACLLLSAGSFGVIDYWINLIWGVLQLYMYRFIIILGSVVASGVFG